MSPSLLHALSVGLTLVLLLAGYHIVQRLIDRLVQRVAARQTDTGRSRTLGSLLTSLIRWALAFTVLVIILRELGVDVQAIVVSAGVLGIVIGFGAQALIRDLLTGIFLLFEALVAVGDEIQVGTATGTVESIGLRVTKLRLPDGAVRVVPNGALTEFTNFSAGWARATGAALDAPSVQGIMRFSGGDAVLRLTVRVDPSRRVDAENDLRRQIKATFDRERLSAVGV